MRPIKRWFHGSSRRSARASPLPAAPRSGTQALLGEIYMWGVALTFLVVGWRYDAALLIQGVIVSLGISLIARAAIHKPLR